MQLSMQQVLLLAGALLALSTSTSAVPALVPHGNGDDVVLLIVRHDVATPSTRAAVPLLLARGGHDDDDTDACSTAAGPVGMSASVQTLDHARAQLQELNRKLVSKTLNAQQVRILKQHKARLGECIAVMQRTQARQARVGLKIPKHP